MKTRRAIFLAVGLALVLSASALPAADDGWRQLTPSEKERVLRNYRRWQNLPPQDKEHLREQWNRWQRLPQDRRERLKERYDEQRRNRDRD